MHGRLGNTYSKPPRANAKPRSRPRALDHPPPPKDFAHVTFCYLVALSGFGCLVTRAWPRAHPAHAYLGRCYIVFMLWATATSLLIHNTGLPTAVLVSFIWVLGGLTIGWAAIQVHQARAAAAAARAAQEAIKSEGGVPGGDLAALVAREKGRIASDKTLAQRMLGLKALHGAVMFTSWINIVGERGRARAALRGRGRPAGAAAAGGCAARRAPAERFRRRRRAGAPGAASAEAVRCWMPCPLPCIGPLPPPHRRPHLCVQPVGRLHLLHIP